MHRHANAALTPRRRAQVFGAVEAGMTLTATPWSLDLLSPCRRRGTRIRHAPRLVHRQSGRAATEGAALPFGTWGRAAGRGPGVRLRDRVEEDPCAGCSP